MIVSSTVPLSATKSGFLLDAGVRKYLPLSRESSDRSLAYKHTLLVLPIKLGSMY